MSERQGESNAPHNGRRNGSGSQWQIAVSPRLVKILADMVEYAFARDASEDKEEEVESAQEGEEKEQ